MKSLDKSERCEFEETASVSRTRFLTFELALLDKALPLPL